jgi:SAM-dependent methyltransferase
MGENALVLARQGARLTLVDQDPTVAPRLRALFQDFGLAARLRELVIGDIQSIRFDRRFALVTAEGFVATLPDRDAVIARMCAALVPGGIAVTSYPDRFGSFFEFLKKAVMWRAYQLAGITDLLDSRAEALAARLFEPALDALGSTRPFRVWWLDCLVAPFLTWDLCWSPDAILDVATRCGAAFYAATPRVWEPDSLDWFKRVAEPDAINRAVAAGYAVRKYDLMFGRHVTAGIDPTALGDLDQAIAALLQSWSVWFADRAGPPPALDFRPVAAGFRAAGIDIPELEGLVAVLDLVAGDDLDALVSGYLGRPEITRCWGKSYQYLALVRAGQAG